MVKNIIAPSDSALAKCVGAPVVEPTYFEESVVALVKLVQSFAPPELSTKDANEWVNQMSQYLINSDLDVYLGYLAPTTVQ